MVRIVPWLAGCLIGVAALARAQAKEIQSSLHLSYRLSPTIEANQLQALAVHVAFDLPTEGELRWKPPQGIAAHHPSRFVSAPVVHAASLKRDADGSWIIRGRKSARVTMDYVVNPVSRGEHAHNSIYEGIWISHGQFEALGNDLFATPIGYDDAPLAFDWNAPAGWSVATPLSTFGTDRITVTHLTQSSFVGGQGMSEIQRPIRGGTLLVASVGVSMRLEPFADAMVPVINELRAFWGDTTGNFVVTLLAMAPGPEDLVGIGRDGGFVAEMKSNTTRRNWPAWRPTSTRMHGFPTAPGARQKALVSHWPTGSPKASPCFIPIALSCATDA